MRTDARTGKVFATELPGGHSGPLLSHRTNLREGPTDRRATIDMVGALGRRGVKADPSGAEPSASVAVLRSSIRRACQVVFFDLSCAGLCADDEGVGNSDCTRHWQPPHQESPGSRSGE